MATPISAVPSTPILATDQFIKSVTPGVLNGTSTASDLSSYLFSNNTTDSLSEGVTNLYFSNSKVYSAFAYGNGINSILGTSGTLAVDINAINLKFDTGVLNTIQDISTVSSPTFQNLILSDTYKGSLKQISLPAGVTVATTSNVGVLNVSTSASSTTLTINLAAIPVGTQFEMLRSGAGSFTLSVSPGITLNGVDGGSVALLQQFDRLMVSQVSLNNITAIGYSGAAQDLQTTYNNSVTGNIVLAAGKHITYTSTDAAFALPEMLDAEFDAIPTPPAGLMAWSESSDRIRVNKGDPAFPIYDDVAYISDVNQLLDSNYGEMHFSGNAAETVINTISTPVKVVATYSSGLLDNWSQASGTLTWTSADTKVFAVAASVTLTPDLTTDDFTVFIALNGVVVSKSQGSVYFGPTVPAPKNVKAQGLIEVSTNDTIEVWVQNNTSTNNVTALSLNLFAIEATGGLGGTGGGGTSGNSGLGVVSETGATGTTIDTQLFEKIGTVTHYNTSISFTPTANIVALTLSTPTAGVLVQANGSGSLSVVTLSSDIAPRQSQTLAVCTVPTAVYPIGVPTSVMGTINGSKIIPANSINIGDQFKLSCRGIVQSIGSGGTGTLQFVIGPNVLTTPNMSESNAGTRWWEVDFIATAVAVNTMRIAAVGYRVRINNTLDPLEPPIAALIDQEVTVDFSLANQMDILYDMTVGNSQYAFIADSATITKLIAPSTALYSSEFRSISATPSANEVLAAFTISDANVNKAHRLNLSFSYEE